MYTASETRRLLTSEDAIDLLNATVGDIEYRGVLLASGLDTAIEVVENDIEVFLQGKPAPAGHRVLKVFELCREEILKAVKELSGKTIVKVALVGRWHDAEPDEIPMFIGYLVHVIDTKGEVATRKYDMRIFNWDNTPNGRAFWMTVSGGNAEDSVFALRHYAETKARLSSAWRSASGQHLFDGAIFFPTAAESAAPVMIFKCTGVKAM